MVDVLILLIFSLAFFFLVFENLRLKNKYTQALTDLLKSRMDNNILKEGASVVSKIKTEKDPSEEHFIKFLSDSRDSAFSYIESVQKEIFNYINTVESQVNQTNNEVLIKELLKIKKLLPDDYGTIER